MRLSARRRAQWQRNLDFLQDDTGTDIGLWSDLPEVIRMGRGEPIVLVPGLAGGWRLLAPLARRLATTNEVILLGLRGDCGTLASPAYESISRYARDVADRIEQLRLERPTVCGVSFGGAVALELATENPGLVGALVLHGTEARFHSGLGALIARRVLERFPLPRDNRFVNQFFNLLYGGKPEPGPVMEFVVERCWQTDQAVMASRIRALESFDVSDRLWRIDVPTIVVAGMRDVIVPPARQRALADSIPGARFESIAGAGHIGFLTHGDELGRHVGRLQRDLAGISS